MEAHPESQELRLPMGSQSSLWSRAWTRPRGRFSLSSLQAPRTGFPRGSPGKGPTILQVPWVWKSPGLILTRARASRASPRDGLKPLGASWDKGIQDPIWRPQQRGLCGHPHPARGLGNFTDPLTSLQRPHRKIPPEAWGPDTRSAL